MRGPKHCLLIFCALLVCCVLGVSTTTCASPPPTTLTSTAIGLPAVQPADFGFVASYGAYGNNRLDTLKGTFTKDIISQTKPNPTVGLRLTAEELAGLYQDLRAMRILDYPAYMDPSNTGKTGVTASTPTSYRLEIRAGGAEKSITWVHGEFARTAQARALLDWFEKLRQIIEAKPEYQRMPPIEGGYA
jgi:hypothetical protein